MKKEKRKKRKKESSSNFIFLFVIAAVLQFFADMYYIMSKNHLNSIV